MGEKYNRELNHHLMILNNQNARVMIVQQVDQALCMLRDSNCSGTSWLQAIINIIERHSA